MEIITRLAFSIVIIYLICSVAWYVFMINHEVRRARASQNPQEDMSWMHNPRLRKAIKQLIWLLLYPAVLGFAYVVGRLPEPAATVASIFLLVIVVAWMTFSIFDFFRQRRHARERDS